MPNLAIATVLHSPYVGGKLTNFDASAADSKLKIFKITNGVAIVGDSTYQIFGAKNKIKAEWTNPNGSLTSAVISDDFKKLGSSEGRTIKEEGSFSDNYSSSPKKIDYEYELPFIAHAPMEPINCTANFMGNKIEVWAPTQSPQPIQNNIASTFGIPVENVIVHTLFCGGGFGRRLIWDFPFEAVEISANIGKPVKVIWWTPAETEKELVW